MRWIAQTGVAIPNGGQVPNPKNSSHGWQWSNEAIGCCQRGKSDSPVAVVIAATTTDPLIFQDGFGGTTLLAVQVPANGTLVLPFTEAPWLITTIRNGRFFDGLTTTTETGYYTIP